MLGGIIFNLFFAYFAIAWLFATGMPKTPILYPEDSKVVVDTVIKNSSAEKAGILSGESISKINDTTVANNLKKTMSTLKEHSNKPATLTLEKDGSTREVAVDLADTLGVTFKEDSKIVYAKPLNIFESLKRAAQTSWDISSRVAKSLVELVKNGKKDNMGGPLMVIKELVSKAQRGFSIFFVFLAFISINLAVLNLIPLPIFDGGQIVKVTIEAIIGKPLPEKAIYYIDYACWISVILLMVYISFFDLKKIIGF